MPQAAKKYFSSPRNLDICGVKISPQKKIEIPSLIKVMTLFRTTLLVGHTPLNLAQLPCILLATEFTGANGNRSVTESETGSTRAALPVCGLFRSSINWV
ncbi:hypothetical protein RSAG8_02921, partial [Rhizoctonia solani AG-8 WAC10335]